MLLMSASSIVAVAVSVGYAPHKDDKEAVGASEASCSAACVSPVCPFMAARAFLMATAVVDDEGSLLVLPPFIMSLLTDEVDEEDDKDIDDGGSPATPMSADECCWLCWL